MVCCRCLALPSCLPPRGDPGRCPGDRLLAFTAAGRLAAAARREHACGSPSSSSRAAGDTEDAELIVYFFGPGRGRVDANIDRWVGQMEQPDGGAEGKARRDAQTVNGLKVTMVDVSGTYIAEMRPGAAEHFNKPGFRLRAAVVETPRGPYYIKMTGPAKRWRPPTRTSRRSSRSLASCR